MMSRGRGLIKVASVGARPLGYEKWIGSAHMQMCWEARMLRVDIVCLCWPTDA